MGRSPNAVMHLLRRALRTLRGRLAETDSLALPSRRLEDVGADEGRLTGGSGAAAEDSQAALGGTDG
jgi:hypothetical protein